MKHPALPQFTALMAAIALPSEASGIPDWIHVLPAPQDGKILTSDARGPYKMGDAQAIVAASFANTDALEVDVNHSTYTAAPRGERSDAVGWVREMKVEADGIHARVEWNAEGQRLVSERAYRKISPVIIHDAQKNILRIANISLVNRPNLVGLTALNMETQMTLAQRLAQLLGKPETATEDELLAAIPSAIPALQSAMAEIGVAFGMDGTNTQAVVAAVKAAKAGATEVVALQSKVTVLEAKLTGLEAAGKRVASEAYVDGEIAKKRVGLNATTRETYISLHMEQPDTAKALIESLPTLGPAGLTTTPPTATDSEITSLNAEQISVADQLGIPHETYLANLKADAKKKDARA